MDVFEFPQPKRSVALDTSIGALEGTMKGTTEIYLPTPYREIECHVLEYTVKLQTLTHIVSNLRFVLSGQETVLDRLFVNEEWKRDPIVFFFQSEERKYRPVQKGMLPIAFYQLNPYLRIDSVKIRGPKENTLCRFDPSIDFVALPGSFPPLVDYMPINRQYMYFYGKTTAVYFPIILGQQYEIETEMEAINVLYDHTVLMPFGKVTFNLPISVSTSSRYVLKSRASLLLPITGRQLPPDLISKFEAIELGEISRPIYKPALPFRQSEIRFREQRPIDKSKKDVMLRNYSAVLVEMELGRPVDKDYEVIVTTTKREIPVRVYELMQELTGFRDFLVSVDIFNFRENERLEVEVETKIEEYSNSAIDNLSIPAHGEVTIENGKTKNPSRAVLSQIPRMLKEVRRTITKPTIATLTCQIVEKKSREPIHRSTHLIKLLPEDFMVWSLDDAKGGHMYHLFDFIAAWIYVSDADGLLDIARAGAAKYHPEGYFIGYTTDRIEVRRQIKALYDYLAQERQLTYVNQAFIFGISEDGQRVHPPEKVLRNRGGNCIDLVVLMASLLEGLGINPLIFLTRNHAFLGWGNKTDVAQIEFLECTGIGSMQFEEAQSSAHNTFIKEFLFDGYEDLLPNEIIYHSKGAILVDLGEAREKGIHRVASLE